jgi:hypothetical protein
MSHALKELLHAREDRGCKRIGKRTYNNVISVLRGTFEFGYRDYPGQHNPTLSFASARIKKKD